MRTDLSIRTAALASLTALLLAGAPAALASGLDGKIESSARSSYNFKTWLKDDHIEVKSSSGVVTLSGTVSEEHHKVLAEETVSNLPGTKRVDNRLTVAGERPGERSDAWISLEIKAALAFHKDVSATATEVHTQGGVVSLSGTADSEAQKELTTAWAKDVEGVTAVHNEMTVSPPGKSTAASVEEAVDDASITAQIKTTLVFHKTTHALATQVSTKDGVVTLKGKAGSSAERELVGKLAQDIGGVKQVKNRMTVPKT